MSRGKIGGLDSEKVLGGFVHLLRFFFVIMDVSCHICSQHSFTPDD